MVAAVIERDGRWFVAERPNHKHHGGLWEFPGGKVDAGETLEDALARELAEELGVALERCGPTLHCDHDTTRKLRLHFIAATITGTPRLLEHSACGWFTPIELGALPLAPADARFAATLNPRPARPA